MVLFLIDGDLIVGEINIKMICINVYNVNEIKVFIFVLGFGFNMNFDFLIVLFIENGGSFCRIYLDKDVIS